jgi:hypothetical protein
MGSNANFNNYRCILVFKLVLRLGGKIFYQGIYNMCFFARINFLYVHINEDFIFQEKNYFSLIFTINYARISD